METLTYAQLRDKANKALNAELKKKFDKRGMQFAPFNHPQKDILIWALLNGYKKKRIQRNKIRQEYYIKY